MDLRPVQDTGKDEIIFSLDLPITLDNNQMSLSEISEVDIPDEVLADLMENVSENNIQNTIENQGTVTVADDNSNKSHKKSFEVLSEQDVNEIASKVAAKGTKKQTIWGVTVFRGNFVFKYTKIEFLIFCFKSHPNILTPKIRQLNFHYYCRMAH